MNNHSSVKAQAERGSDGGVTVIVLSCYYSQPIVPYRSGVITMQERYDLYTKPRGFFARLADPELAEIYHQRSQNEYLKQSNVYQFRFEKALLFIEFNFDTSEVTRARLASAYYDGKLEKVKLND